MHLYEITKQLNELLALEDIPRDQIEDTINLIEEEFECKAEMVAAYISELEADEAGLKSEIDRLSANHLLPIVIILGFVAHIADMLFLNIGLRLMSGYALPMRWVTLSIHVFGLSLMPSLALS